MLQASATNVFKLPVQFPGPSMSNADADTGKKAFKNKLGKRPKPRFESTTPQRGWSNGHPEQHSLAVSGKGKATFSKYNVKEKRNKALILPPFQPSTDEYVEVRTWPFTASANIHTEERSEDSLCVKPWFDRPNNNNRSKCSNNVYDGTNPGKLKRANTDNIPQSRTLDEFQANTQKKMPSKTQELVRTLEVEKAKLHSELEAAHKDSEFLAMINRGLVSKRKLPKSTDTYRIDGIQHEFMSDRKQLSKLKEMMNENLELIKNLQSERLVQTREHTKTLVKYREQDILTIANLERANLANEKVIEELRTEASAARVEAELAKEAMLKNAAANSVVENHIAKKSGIEEQEMVKGSNIKAQKKQSASETGRKTNASKKRNGLEIASPVLLKAKNDSGHTHKKDCAPKMLNVQEKNEAKHAEGRWDARPFSADSSSPGFDSDDAPGDIDDYDDVCLNLSNQSTKAELHLSIFGLRNDNEELQQVAARLEIKYAEVVDEQKKKVQQLHKLQENCKVLRKRLNAAKATNLEGDKRIGELEINVNILKAHLNQQTKKQQEADCTVGLRDNTIQKLEDKVNELEIEIKIRKQETGNVANQLSRANVKLVDAHKLQGAQEQQSEELKRELEVQVKLVKESQLSNKNTKEELQAMFESTVRTERDLASARRDLQLAERHVKDKETVLEFRDDEIKRLGKECAQHIKCLGRCSTEAVRAIQRLKDEGAVMQVRGQLDAEAQVLEAFSILGECEGKLVNKFEALAEEKNRIALETTQKIKEAKELALENLVRLCVIAPCVTVEVGGDDGHGGYKNNSISISSPRGAKGPRVRCRPKPPPREQIRALIQQEILPKYQYMYVHQHKDETPADQPEESMEKWLKRVEKELKCSLQEHLGHLFNGEKFV